MVQLKDNSYVIDYSDCPQDIKFINFITEKLKSEQDKHNIEN